MGVFTIEIGMKLLLVLPCLVSLALAVPVEILSYSAAEEKHDHKMEGVPGEAVMGEFSFQAPDTGDAVYKLTYTADMDGFQAMGDHLPFPVIMDPVPEAALPEMVDYTPEVAAATTYHHLAGAYPLHQVRAPIVSQPVYSYPIYRILPQVATDVSATIEEGDDEPAALAL